MSKRLPENPEREERIQMEIVVDAYGPEEQAVGWYCYLGDALGFPFSAECSLERSTSPLKKGEKLEVIGMAAQEDCETEMFVTVRWSRRTLAVPLGQIAPIPSTDEDTKEAIADWHYWLARGYGF